MATPNRVKRSTILSSTIDLRKKSPSSGHLPKRAHRATTETFEACEFEVNVHERMHDLRRKLMEETGERGESKSRGIKRDLVEKTSGSEVREGWQGNRH
jgi:hypothetical protein